MANGEFTLSELKHPEQVRSTLAELLRARDPDYPETTSTETLRAADRALIESGALTETELLSFYAQALGVAIPDEELLPEPEPFEGLSDEFLDHALCLPVAHEDNRVRLLVCDPYELAEQAAQFGRLLNLTCSFSLVRRTVLERLLSRNRHDQEETDELDFEDETTLRTMAGDARIVRLVNDIFSRAIELGASDIHVEPEPDRVSVRCRVDGVLTEILSCPPADFPAIASRIKLLGGLNIAESRLPQDGRTNFHLGRIELDMRISTIPILTGESIVLRLLTRDAINFDLHGLGMSQEMLARFEKLIRIPHGIILVVGPTGSGKTTTLYSVIARLNDQKRKIITIEDPVEYQTPGLCQMQVNPKIGVTFASGLRHIVRQDPDVILVGEIRDLETADIAINAALTGHLVLSTLHTNDAVGAITRLLDMGVEGFLISSALYGVLSQRLVRRICPVCGGTGVDPAQPGNRCRRCNAAGFKGRSGIFELLLVNDEMRRAINGNLPSSELQKIAVRGGMKSLLEDGQAKVAAGITTLEELGRSTAELE